MGAGIADSVALRILADTSGRNVKKPWAYLNENDSKAAAWLRELIAADVIVRGEVDERDIREVRPSDLDGFTQCHFFAGIGGWSYALRLAGWPDSEPVWTGSCPCQPFSAAGKGGGTDDERHLWPAFYQLIAHARPAVVFGEQVASPAGLQWLAVVQTDLENSEYAVGVADLPAACVGAPHIRQRLFWVGHSNSAGLQTRNAFPLAGRTRPQLLDESSLPSNGLGDTGSAGLSQRVGDGCVQREALESLPRQAALGAGHPVDLGIPASGGRERIGIESTHRESVQTGAAVVDLADADGLVGAQGGSQSRGRNTRGDEEPGPGPGGGQLLGQVADAAEPRSELERRRSVGELGDADGARAGWDTGATAVPVREIPCERNSLWQHAAERAEPSGDVGHMAHADGGDAGAEGPQRSGQYRQFQEDGGVSFWSDCDWIPCRDGKSRPVESGTFPLAHGISGRVGLLRGYGNAIVPQVAAQFIGAYIDILGE